MSKVTDPALLAELEGQPQQSGWKIPPTVQQSRDRDRLAILEQEYQDNPNDVALQREVTAERRKQGASAPGKVTDPALLAELEGQPDQQSAQQQKPAQQSASFARRIVEGINDPIVGAAQIMDKVLVNPIRQLVSPGASSMEDVVRARDAAYRAPEGIDVARAVGNVANPMSWMGGGASPLRGAVAGALQSSLAPVSADEDFARAKAQQAGTGAILGTVLSKALRGMSATPEAQQLMQQGVQPTVGQALGGWKNQLEQKATSIPFVGDAINYARRNAQEDFERAALARAVQTKAPGNPSLPPSMLNAQPKTLDEAFKLASELYDSVVPHLKPTPQAEGNILIALGNASRNPELTDEGLKMIQGIVGKYFPRFNDLSGEAIKRLDSELGHLARKYKGGSPSERTIAAEVYKLQDGMRRGLEYGLEPEKQGILSMANEIWRNLVPISQAASRRGDEKILPRALQQTMARQAKIDTARFADPLIDPALKVLPSNVPDSGTGGRVLLGGVLSGTIGSLPQYLAAGGASYLGATRPAQAALLGNTRLQRALQPYDAQIAAATAAALRNANRKQQSGNE